MVALAEMALEEGVVEVTTTDKTLSGERRGGALEDEDEEAGRREDVEEARCGVPKDGDLPTRSFVVVDGELTDVSEMESSSGRVSASGLKDTIDRGFD